MHIDANDAVSQWWSPRLHVDSDKETAQRLLDFLHRLRYEEEHIIVAVRVRGAALRVLLLRLLSSRPPAALGLRPSSLSRCGQRPLLSPHCCSLTAHCSLLTAAACY